MQITPNFTLTPTIAPSPTVTNVTTTMQFQPTDLYGALIVILIFALFIGIIYLYEIKKSFNNSGIMEPDARKETIQSLNSLLAAETKKLSESSNTPNSADYERINNILDQINGLTDNKPAVIPWFTRGQIAITIIFLIGMAFILIVFSAQSNATILSSVISILGTTLAAVIGFYFGGKQQEDASKKDQTGNNGSGGGNAPVADFKADPTTVDTSTPVQFTDLSKGASAWTWDFGDGKGTSPVQNPKYTFPDAGKYTVKLTVKGPGGENAINKTDYITVTQKVV